MMFQIALVMFAVVAWRKTWKQFQAQHVSQSWLVFASLFWILVMIVALLPGLTDILAAWVGVERGADLMTYIAVVVLSAAVLRLLARQQELGAEITALARQIALGTAMPPKEEKK